MRRLRQLFHHPFNNDGIAATIDLHLLPLFDLLTSPPSQRKQEDKDLDVVMENWPCCIGIVLAFVTVTLTMLGKFLSGDFISTEKLELEFSRCYKALADQLHELRQNYSTEQITTVAKPNPADLEVERRQIYDRCNLQSHNESSLNGAISNLHCAAFLGVEECLRVFGRSNGRSSDVNFVDPVTGMTPLHFASLAGKRSCVTKLFNLGSDLSATDPAGRTALMIAESANFSDCANRFQQLSGQALFSNLLLASVTVMIAVLLVQELRRAIRQRQNLSKKLAFDVDLKKSSLSLDDRMQRECLICFCDLHHPSKKKDSAEGNGFDFSTTVPLSLQGVFGFTKSSRGATVRCKNCNRAFHGACLAQWIIRKPTCPNCREPFFDENVAGDYANFPAPNE